MRENPPSPDQLSAEIGEVEPFHPNLGRVPNAMLPYNYDPPDSRDQYLANQAASGNKLARRLLWLMIIMWIVVPVLVGVLSDS